MDLHSRTAQLLPACWPTRHEPSTSCLCGNSKRMTRLPLHRVGHPRTFVSFFTGYSPICAETATLCILCMLHHSLGVYSAQVPKSTIHARDLPLALSLQQCRHHHTLVGVAAALGLEPCCCSPQTPQLLLQCLFCCCAALQLLPCCVSSPPGTKHSIESHTDRLQSQSPQKKPHHNILSSCCAEGRQGRVCSSMHNPDCLLVLQASLHAPYLCCCKSCCIWSISCSCSAATCFAAARASLAADRRPVG